MMRILRQPSPTCLDKELEIHWKQMKKRQKKKKKVSAKKWKI
jgi:hypothetical protein